MSPGPSIFSIRGLAIFKESANVLVPSLIRRFLRFFREDGRVFLVGTLSSSRLLFVDRALFSRNFSGNPSSRKVGAIGPFLSCYFEERSFQTETLASPPPPPGRWHRGPYVSFFFSSSRRSWCALSFFFPLLFCVVKRAFSPRADSLSLVPSEPALSPARSAGHPPPTFFLSPCAHRLFSGGGGKAPRLSFSFFPTLPSSSCEMTEAALSGFFREVYKRAVSVSQAPGLNRSPLGFFPRSLFPSVCSFPLSGRECVAPKSPFPQGGLCDQFALGLLLRAFRRFSICYSHRQSRGAPARPPFAVFFDSRSKRTHFGLLKWGAFFSFNQIVAAPSLRL